MQDDGAENTEICCLEPHLPGISLSTDEQQNESVIDAVVSAVECICCPEKTYKHINGVCRGVRFRSHARKQRLRAVEAVTIIEDTFTVTRLYLESKERKAIAPHQARRRHDIGLLMARRAAGGSRHGFVDNISELSAESDG